MPFNAKWSSEQISYMAFMVLVGLESVHFEVGDAVSYDIGVHGHKDMYGFTELGIRDFRGTVCLVVSPATHFFQIVTESVIAGIGRML